MAVTEIKFSTFNVTRQVFYKSKHTYGLVNLKPLVRGHVLIVPLRSTVFNLADMTPEESIDYMQVLQLLHRFIKHIYKADALNISIQDGPELGQSVPHLHTHILPRYGHDGYGDDIYAKLDNIDLETYYAQFGLRKDNFRQHREEFQKQIPQDENREPRTIEVMEREAKWLQAELDKYVAQLDHGAITIPET